MHDLTDEESLTTASRYRRRPGEPLVSGVLAGVRLAAVAGKFEDGLTAPPPKRCPTWCVAVLGAVSFEIDDG